MPFAERQRGLRGRHHLRHELRVRLRLPARQHGPSRSSSRPAQPRVRDRGRGRLDPRRRGADAADHLRRAGDGRAGLLRLRADRRGRWTASRSPRRSRAAAGRGAEPPGRRLHSSTRSSRRSRRSRVGDREGRARARDRQPLRPAQRPARQPPDPGAEGAGALPARRRLRRPGRRGEDRRRVHRPDHGRAPLVARASTRRSRRRKACAIQEEHVTLATITLQNYFRLYEKLGGMTGTAKTEEKEFVEIYGMHVVEIPTNVPVARNDKNDFIFKTKEGEVRGGHRRHQGASRDGPAGARRHDRRRDVRVPLRAAHARRDHAQRPEREGARARGGDHRRRRPARRGHDRDEHGRPRRRHQARRGRARARRPLRARHRAPRGAPHRQPAARPLGPPGRPRRDRASTSPAQDDLVRLFAGDRIYKIIERFKIPDDQPMEAKILSRPDRDRAEEGRGAELRRAQERPQVRRRHEHAARR